SQSIVRGWVNTPKLAELAGLASLGGGLTAAGSGAQVQQLATMLRSVQSLSFAAWATDGGYHLTFRGTLAPGADSSLFPASQPSSLTGLVPADAFAYLAFGNAGSYLQQAFDNAGASGPALKQFQLQTGISVKDDLI